MIEGRRYAHIMDPRNGMPVADMASVTVVAPTALGADVLSTAIFVNRGAGIAALLKRHPGVSVLLIRADADGRLIYEKYGDVWDEVADEEGAAPTASAP